MRRTILFLSVAALALAALVMPGRASALSARPGAYVSWAVTLKGTDVDWGFAGRMTRKSPYLRVQSAGTTPFVWRRIDAPLPWQTASGTPTGRYVRTWIFKKHASDGATMTRVIHLRVRIAHSASSLADGTRLCYRIRHDVDGFDSETHATYRYCVRVQTG